MGQVRSGKRMCVSALHVFVYVISGRPGTAKYVWFKNKGCNYDGTYKEVYI